MYTELKLFVNQKYDFYLHFDCDQYGH